MAVDERAISLQQRLDANDTARQDVARSCAPFLKMAAAILGMDQAFLSLVTGEQEIFIASSGAEIPPARTKHSPGISAVKAGGLSLAAAGVSPGGARREGLFHFAYPLTVPEIREAAVISFIGPNEVEPEQGLLLPLAGAAAHEIVRACALIDQDEKLRELKMDALGEFAGGVAHDFNNLLTVINGYARRLVDRTALTDPRRQDLEKLRAAGESAAQLAQHLLAIGCRQVMHPEPVDLNEIIRSSTHAIAGPSVKRIELALDLHPELDNPNVDPAQIEQAIRNLVQNACDAMPKGGRLQIETSNVDIGREHASAHPALAHGRYVLLSVSDTGTGMTPEVLSRIFEPFFTTKPKGQGTGLGLPTVFGIVKQSGGHLAVASEPGRGSTFKVYLPVARRAEDGMRDRASEEIETGENRSQSGPEGITILLVEDDERVRKFTTSVLDEYGYRVIAVADSQEARAIVLDKEQEIDLLLIDVVLPKTSGRKLAEELLAHRPWMKTLFMSGYTRQSLLARREIAEEAIFLQKPFTAESLAASVHRALTRPQEPAAEPAARPAAPALTSVLVVDDDAAIRDYLKKVLGEAGFAVTVVGDGNKALRIYREAPTDLVLMDLVMPEREGIETIQILKREFPKAKIVAMSGAVGGPILAAARMLGANEILQKPINEQDLIKLLHRLHAMG